MFDVEVEVTATGFAVREVGYRAQESPCDHGFRKTGNYVADLGGERFVLKWQGGAQTLWRIDDDASAEGAWPDAPKVEGAWRWEMTSYDDEGHVHDETEWWQITRRTETQLDLTYRRRVVVRSADGTPITCAGAPSYTFDGQLPSRTFTAHPKVDSHTGNMVAFGYESEGHGSDVVTMFEFTPQGQKVWDAKIQVPYVGMLHDFAVTERYVVFYVIPMTIDQPQMERGGIHWSWDGTKPTYFGFVRRGGDGKDVRWIEGPTRSATHVMGAFDDAEKLVVDVEMSMSNPFPFMPMRDGSRWDPVSGSSHITRLTVDLARRRPSAYGIEQMYPHVGALPRQDDRYNTVPYRYGFLGCPDPNAAPGTGGACYARFDHQNRTSTLFNAGTETTLAECCFAPKSQNAPEGAGYLMGLGGLALARLSEDDCRPSLEVGLGQVDRTA